MRYGQLQRKAGSSTPVKQTAERGTGGSAAALPHIDRIQESFGEHEVGSVQAHVGPGAQAACDDMGAEAFASGDSVAFRDTPDLHTAAHEAAHVIQQRQGVDLPGGVGAAGDQYERQADAVADAVVRGEDAGPLLGAPGPDSPRATVAVQKKEAMVDARRYLRANLGPDNLLSPYIAQTLRRLPLALPTPFATWRGGGSPFLMRVTRELVNAAGSVDAQIRKLALVLLPASLDAIVDQSRTLEPGKKEKDGDAVGSTRVFADVGVRIGTALHRAVHRALPRVLERYLAERCGPQAKPLEDLIDGSHWPEPDASSILASHPIDPFIAAALCDKSVDVDGDKYRAANGTNEANGGAGDSKADVVWRFVDDPDAPNWVEVIAPSSVSVEQVSTAVFGGTRAATAITVAHPYYGLELADARAVRKRQGLPTAPARDADGLDDWFEDEKDVKKRVDNTRDPAFGLLNSKLADDAALAQAGQLDAGKADRGKLMKSLERSRGQLDYTRDVANRFSVGGDLGAVRAQIDGRLSTFASAPESQVAKWHLHVTKQHDVLFGVSRGLSQIDAQLTAMGIKGRASADGIPAVVWKPMFGVVRKFIDAAALSHLVGVGLERLQAAETELKLAPLATLDLILDDVRDKTEHARRAGRNHQVSSRGDSYKQFKTGKAAHDEAGLREEVAIVRAKMLDGDPSAGAMIADLYKRVSKMQVETDIASKYAMLAQLSHVFYELRVSSWSVATFQDDDAGDYESEAFRYASRFRQAYSHFVDGEEAEMQKVLDDLGKDEKFKSFLKRAHDEIDDIQSKHKIAQIATIVGIVVASLFTGPVGGGLARRAGMGVVGQFIASSAAEAATYSVLDAKIFASDDVAGTFASEMAVNMATFGLLRAWKARKVAQKADDALAVAKLDSATKLEKIKGYALKGADLTAQGMLIAAASYAQMQYDAYRQTGRYVSVEEMLDMGREGLAMVAATAIGGKLLQKRLHALEDAIAGPAGAKLSADYKALEKMAKAVEKSKDPQAALELIRADRRLMDAELRALRTASGKADPAAMRDQTAALERRSGQLDLAELSLALDEVVPGRRFLGTPEQLAPFLDRFRAKGAEVSRVTVEPSGDVRYEVKDGERRFTLDEAKHYTTAAGGKLNARDPVYEQHSVAGYADSLEDGEQLMRRLAAGDGAALKQLGVDLKGAKSNEVEWGLGRQWDGKIVVVVGSFLDVDWSKLPHIKPLAHSHPATPDNRLVGKDGSGEVALDDLLSQHDLGADRLHLLPSPGDLAFLAFRQIKGHRVITPFRSRGEGKVGNATPNDAAPVVEFVVLKSSYAGRWSLNPDFAVYKAEIEVFAGGKSLGKRFTVHGLDAGPDSAMRKSIPVAKNDRRGPPPPRSTTDAPRSSKATAPSKDVNPVAEPSGRRTQISDDDDDATRRSLQRENESADALAKAGYDVEQNPDVAGPNNPDLKIEGRIFDVYSPASGTSAKNIFSTVRDKALRGQAPRIVVNLADSRVRRKRLVQEFKQRRDEAAGLEEVLVIKNGSVFKIYP